MKKTTAGTLIILACLLVLGFFLPLWNISLDAPQYPEGLGMKIWINKLSGDLQTINGLNHYIGMKKIDQQAIPELHIMPYFLLGIIILGLLAGLLRRKWLLYLWVAVFAFSGALAAYDFWKWEYDYGHNLDPTAAIKIPGMTYQPPLLGTKELLNFTAHSYPDIGGMIILGVGLIILYLAIRLALSKKQAL